MKTHNYFLQFIFCLFLVALLGAPAEANVAAETDSEILFHNPFEPILPTPEEKAAVEIEVAPIEPEILPEVVQPILPPELLISGLIWNTDRPQAIVNDQVVDIGDTIANSKIVRINRAGIDIVYQGMLFTITQNSSQKQFP